MGLEEYLKTGRELSDSQLNELNIGRKPEVKEELLHKIHGYLLTYIIATTEVKDADTGYFLCRSVNRLVDPVLIEAAAKVARGLFIKKLPPEKQPIKVAGISNRGKEFAVALSLELGLPNAVTERKQTVDSVDGEFEAGARYDEENDRVIIENVPSFTKGGYYTHYLDGVRPGDRILIPDDFCAFGKTARVFYQALKSLNIEPSFVFLVVKDLEDFDPPQAGYRELLKEGIPAFAIARLTGVEDGQVLATTEDIPIC